MRDGGSDPSRDWPKRCGRRTLSWLTKLCRQAGVKHAIGGPPEVSSVANGERPWDYLPLLRRNRRPSPENPHPAEQSDRKRTGYE